MKRNLSTEPPLSSEVMLSSGVEVADWSGERLTAARLAPASDSASALTFDQVYEDYFDEVSRWMRALGGPEAEREDLVQDVFLVVHRRLSSFNGDNLPGWLYQIARRRVRDLRRLVWFRVAFRSTQADETLVHTDIDPEVALRQKQSGELLHRLLSTLSDNQRSAFVLFEMEGYSGEDIARIQAVPVATVRARVFKARRKLVALVSRLRASRGGLR